jgi:aminopeptidase N
MAARADQGRRPILRQDYQPPAWLIDHVDMTIELGAEETRVHADLHVRRNPAARDRRAPLKLHGVGLGTDWVKVDGQSVGPRQRSHDGETMVIGQVPDQARVSTAVRVHPARNTALEGLYASGKTLLTQCEAEGFRKITWFLDRPDVMSTYRVRLQADRADYPLLLSNGNLIDSGELDDQQHFAVWEDPFPKPSYLFALVAGNMARTSDSFETRSGRQVALKIYSEPENLGRLDHAMASLKRAMAWDEARFGLEYDLDVYHIVATHDFNMGAMENKSLNIFNARYVLADQETATDADYEAVEGVIGHEYFHNWTGNRVTCRDWFQLTLKEGLTVFRDQEFTADLRSRAVKRIDDVASLMARQFPEDAGPMAHSVRPERYIEINNFYTATVYEKGAEVVRMYQTLLGKDGFRRGLDLYFQRHDGAAVTCDDFLAAMADANERDLRQFERWYRQVGTPELAVRIEYDATRSETVLHFTQSLPEHADNRNLGPLMIPVSIGFLGPDNKPLPVTLARETEPGPETRLLVLTQAESEYRFRDLPEQALPSLLRGYSAPVALEFDWSAEDLARLAGHDCDSFNRWRACRRLAERILHEMIDCAATNSDSELLTRAWQAILADEALDPALAAELLTLPSETELAQQREQVDVERIHAARRQLTNQLGQALADELIATNERMHNAGAWSSDGPATARRRLKNASLALLCASGVEAGPARAISQFEQADNMTDRMASLRCLVHEQHPQGAEALAQFEKQFQTDPLVMDKWFAVQATEPGEQAFDKVRALMEHPGFSLRNPNKVRALLGSFSQHNPLAFHRRDGAGYLMLGETIRELDSLNPQVAARMAAAFNRWRAYDDARSHKMKTELEAIAGKKGLSPDVEEIVSAALRARK